MCPIRIWCDYWERIYSLPLGWNWKNENLEVPKNTMESLVMKQSWEIKRNWILMLDRAKPLGFSIIKSVSLLIIPSQIGFFYHLHFFNKFTLKTYFVLCPRNCNIILPLWWRLWKYLQLSWHERVNRSLPDWGGVEVKKNIVPNWRKSMCKG